MYILCTLKQVILDEAMVSRCPKYRNTHCYLRFIRSRTCHYDAFRSINKHLVYIQFIAWTSQVSQQSLTFQRLILPNEVDDHNDGVLFIFLFSVFALFYKCDVLICKHKQRLTVENCEMMDSVYFQKSMLTKHKHVSYVLSY